MNIFLLNFILNLITATVFIYKPRSNPKNTQARLMELRGYFVIIACIQWILISGLRADSVGSDTSNYMRIFDENIKFSWSDIWKYFKDFYFGDYGYGYEPGYVIFEKLVSMISTNHVVYKFIVAIIFMSSMGVFIYRNSEDPFLSFVLYNGMFYNMFSLTGYRQVISVAIGILWSYEYIKKRKFIPFLILVLISSLFHKTTLVFIPFYFISQWKIKKGYVFYTIIAVCVMIVFRNQIFELVKVWVGYEEYTGMDNFTQRNFLMMFVIISVLVMWKYKYFIVNHPEARIYCNGLIMTAVMIPFAMVSPTSMRLVYDFAFQLMFLLPLVVETFKGKRDRFIVYSTIIFVFTYFIAFKTPAYEFFWQ